MGEEQKQVYVEVIRWKGEEVMKRMGPMSEYRAEKVERGLLINMNRDDFGVRFVDAEVKP